jgi:nitroreductase
MDVFTAMEKRRMHRLFTDEPVDVELLSKLVYAAGRAPVARANIRQLIVVTDERLMKTVRQACPGFVNNAPALILVASDLVESEAAVGVRGREHVARLDAGAAVAYLSLAAPALGLGVCTVTSWTEGAVQEIFGLPDHVRPEALVAVGQPVPNPPRGMRRFEPHVYRERFGRPWEAA